MEFFSLFAGSKAPQPLAAATANDVASGDVAPLSVNRRAFEHVAQAAHDMHFAALPGVGVRFKELGYTQNDLQRVLEYVETKAPLLIHVNFERNADAFVRDSHYRNIFEINRTPYSAENPRVDKESKLFNKLYDSAPASERVKYGCLNLFSDPDGVKRAAQSYGYDFLTLRSSLRQGHVTVTHGNSQSNSAEMLGTLCYFGHLLTRCSDGEIADLVRAAGGGQNKADSAGSGGGLSVSSQGYSGSSNGELSNYREIQLHCPVRFATDVELVTVTAPHNDVTLGHIISFASTHLIDLRVSEAGQRERTLSIASDRGLDFRVIAGGLVIRWMCGGDLA